MKKVILIILMFLAAGMIDLKPIDLSKSQSPKISVFVEGAVQNPGYIQLDKYACEQDALNAAVPLSNADLSGINPMTVLKDKDCINIPAKNNTAAAKVSINFSSVEELCTLPGIGEGTAEKIVAYRSESGLYQSLDDLMLVSGIGPSKFDKIKDLICL